MNEIDGISSIVVVPLSKGKQSFAQTLRNDAEYTKKNTPTTVNKKYSVIKISSYRNTLKIVR